MLRTAYARYRPDYTVWRCGMLAATLLGVALLAPVSSAQAAYSAPRTPDGHPDFQGLWGTQFLTPLERPKGVTNLEQTQLQLANMYRTADVELLIEGYGPSVVKGVARTSLVVRPDNGQIPYTDKGLDAVVETLLIGVSGFENPEERPGYERCITGKGQAPIRQLASFVPSQIVQTKDALVISTEDAGGLRIVHLDGASPPPPQMRSFEGWSTGRWEGETLVVETTHTRADDIYRFTDGNPIVVGPNSKVIERFTRVSPTELNYQFTVEDPTYYKAPWLAEYSFTLASATRPLEYSCHEGNRSLPDLLKAWRVGEEKMAKAAKPKKAATKPKAKAKAKPAKKTTRKK